MAVIRLVHWNAEQAGERAARLESLGHRVEAEAPEGPSFVPELREHMPDVVVIDLTRMPSQGRDLGLAIRAQEATRRLPLVFVGREPAELALVRAVLPDARFATWEDIDHSLAAALASPPADPVVPRSLMEGYARTALVAKLGIKPAMTVRLVDAPEHVREVVEQAADGISVTAQAEADVVLLFVRSVRDLAASRPIIDQVAGNRKIWIAWPKGSPGMVAGITAHEVRAAGIAAGLVDFKVAAIDDDWSALLFRRRPSGD